MKEFIRFNLTRTNTIELWHLSLEVEGEVRTNYSNEHNVKDNDGNVCNKAPSNSYVRI
jgi:hypothetical protein